MKHTSQLKILASIVLVMILLAPSAGLGAPQMDASAAPLIYSGIPTFSIVSVVADSSVTIQTFNFPASDSFNVLMNYMGTRGVGGIKVATFDSGAGGSQTLTYSIPAALAGQYQIAIRLQSNTGSGYFAYNWFYNNTTGGGTGGGTQPPGTGYVGYPTFSIQSVVKDNSVTIKAVNLPPNDSFKVLMNYMGTRGVGGAQVGTFDSGTDSTKTLTFSTPAFLYGQYQIAIRFQSTTGSGYFAYNWFYNNTTTGGGTGGGAQPPPTGYVGYPTFSIVSVVRNSTVTIRAKNLPPNDEFKVLMNYMGTAGIGGIKVISIGSGAGGNQTFTFNIPAALYNQHQIAIRLQSKTGSGYFAYNWFYNNNAP